MGLCGLIAGLGNPGREYENTRHNFGFLVVEELLRACAPRHALRTLSGKGDAFHLWRCADVGAPGCDWLFCTPLTYMNRSGEAIQRVAAYYRILTENILVLHDEMDLPLGRMKLKKGGGNAGHKGLQSIQQMLGTPDFFRLRLGIGKQAGREGAAFVLDRFSPDERESLNRTIAAAVQGVELFMRDGPEKSQRFCNGFSGTSE